MNFNDRITYDSAELTQLLESELDKLNPYRFDARYRSLLGNRIIEKLNKWDADIRRQKDTPLTLVVCGEFKRGKSSIINALLGENVVTTNVTTETITVNKISYGPHENFIVMPGGKRLRLSDDELTCDNLKVILADLPGKASRLELKRPIEILKNVTIIDTPGLGDSMQDYADDVSQALKQADAVVYVFSVSYPLSVQEQLFIRTAIKPQKYTDLFLLGNYSDTLDTVESCDRVKQVIVDRIQDILPGEVPLMVSALDERCREMGSKRPNDELSDYLEDNFRQFRADLDKLLNDKRDSVVPDRIERLIRTMVSDIGEDLSAISSGLDMSIGDAQKRVEALRVNKEEFIQDQKQAYSKIDKIAEELRSEALEWLDEFITKMQNDVNSLSKVPAEDIKKYYSMFCIDTLQEAITKCNDYFLVSLFDELNDVAAGLSKNLSFNPDSTSPNFRITLQNKTWTSGDTVSFFTDFTGLSSMPIISPVVNYIAGSMRQKKINNSAPDIVGEIKDQYPVLKSSALQALASAYGELASGAKTQVSEYFAQQIAETEAQSEESAMAARQDENVKQEIREIINEIKDVLHSINEKFVSLSSEAAAMEY